jgi:hypothetical protein
MYWAYASIYVYHPWWEEVRRRPSLLSKIEFGRKLTLGEAALFLKSVRKS